MMLPLSSSKWIVKIIENLIRLIRNIRGKIIEIKQSSVGKKEDLMKEYKLFIAQTTDSSKLK